MSKTILRRLFVLALCACLVLLAVLPAGADFGDYSGDSDFGDSSDWSSSDSDWDWSSSDSDYSSSSESSGGISTIVVGAIIVFIAIVSTSRTKKKKGASGGTSWSAAANRKLKPMAEYEQLDENFDKAELTSKLSNLYVQMQDCWQKKDISPIRPYCTDAFFTQMDNQIQRKKQQGQTNYIERIAVLSVELRGWCQEGGNDVLVARLNTRIVDYTLDDKTGKLISGSRDKEKFMVYEWDLVRHDRHEDREGQTHADRQLPELRRTGRDQRQRQVPVLRQCHHPRGARLRPQRHPRHLSANERITRPGKRIPLKNSTAQAERWSFLKSSLCAALTPAD